MEATHTPSKLETLFHCRASKQHTSEIASRLFTVIQWNVLAAVYSTHEGFPKVDLNWLAIEHRLPLIIQKLRAADADIIAMEEVDYFPDIEKALPGYTWTYQPKFTSDDPNDSQDGNLLGFKSDAWTLNQKSVIAIQEAPGKQPRRSCIHLQLTHQCDGRKLSVFNTHLKAKKAFRPKRLQEVQQIIPKILEALQAGDEIIFLGDFNADPFEEAVAEVKKHGLTKTVASDEVYTTAKLHNQADNHPRQIDYIFHSSGLQVAEAWQESTYPLSATLLPDEHMPSDHLPIYAIFGFRPKQP